ncbi:uncharacterized protein C9orf85 homolog [Paramormyrops kingsleyae]|uniref:Chromosome 9 open reading frame 85 n=1 Tax=Paramormyrops kingsleyae TaxID=1676925 RepID=A0A3B3R6Z5_9TELE|nr:uncharacterized protein C9orf85 homolog [Paramormyrops kingsleyae]
MSSQKGNTARTRGQKYQNTTAFKNNKYGTSVQVKTATAKVHDGVCQHCKDVLEWKVRYNKYKPLTQPRKCVKCLQKTVKDAYYIICKPCALRLQQCAKCGKETDVVIPLTTNEEEEEGSDQASGAQKSGQRQKTKHQKLEDDDSDDFDSDGELDFPENGDGSVSDHNEVHVPDISSVKKQDTS